MIQLFKCCGCVMYVFNGIIMFSLNFIIHTISIYASVLWWCDGVIVSVAATAKNLYTEVRALILLKEKFKFIKLSRLIELTHKWHPKCLCVHFVVCIVGTVMTN